MNSAFKTDPVAAAYSPQAEAIPGTTFAPRGRVLVLEPSLDEARAFHALLQRGGFDVRHAQSCVAGRRLLVEFTPDVIVTNLVLPELRDAALCDHLRTCSLAGIIVVSNSDDERTCAEALRMGADDYVVRPCRANEFVARVQAIARRVKGQNGDAVARGDIAIDLGTRHVTVCNRLVRLRPHEFSLLLHLMRRPSVVHSYRSLLAAVWGPGVQLRSHYVRMAMVHLRRQIEPHPARPRYLLTERGVGYRIEPEGGVGAHAE